MDNWLDDKLQFARLLSEIQAIGLTKKQLRTLCIEMDLKPSDITEVFDRATGCFEACKAILPNAARKGRTENMDTVFVATEHEPDNCEFPVMVKNVFATQELAEDYITRLEAARDEEGEQDDGDLYWALEPCQVLASVDEVLTAIAEDEKSCAMCAEQRETHESMS